MQWAKKRPKVKYDLALSGILNLPFAELEATIEDIDLNGDNSYGYRPLVEALAAHCRVDPESVITISGGTSMANHLAMAAAVEHGDEVLIEQPTYEPLLAVAEYFGARIKRFSRAFENEFRIDVEEIAGQITPDTRLVVLTNLHNPSSTLVDEKALRQIGELAQGVGARASGAAIHRDNQLDEGLRIERLALRLDSGRPGVGATHASVARHLRRVGSASRGKAKRGRAFKIAEVRDPRQTDSGKQSRRAERVSRFTRGSQSGAN